MLDQTAAYDIVEHKLLIDKLKLLKFGDRTLEYMTNYLKDRRQRVIVDGAISDELHIGKMSVIQGSAMSSLLFLIYVMELPTIFQQNKQTPQEVIESQVPTISTFVDDTISTVKLQEDTEQLQIDKVMDLLENYMISNRLQMNRDKTKLFIISNNPNLKLQLHLKDNNKIIKTCQNI